MACKDKSIYYMVFIKKKNSLSIPALSERIQAQKNIYYMRVHLYELQEQTKPTYADSGEGRMDWKGVHRTF